MVCVLVLALYHTVVLPPRLREPHRQQMMSMKKFQIASKTYIYRANDELSAIEGRVMLMMGLTVVIPPTIAMKTEAIAEMTAEIARPTVRYRKRQ